MTAPPTKKEKEKKDKEDTDIQKLHCMIHKIQGCIDNKSLIFTDLHRENLPLAEAQRQRRKYIKQNKTKKVRHN